MPDLEVCVAPVLEAPARLVMAAAVRGALVTVAAVAGGLPDRSPGERPVAPDVEVTIAKDWPFGWAGVLVVGVTPGGFVALGIARAQPVEVVAAGGAVVADAAAAGIPLDSAAAILAPALLRLSCTRTHTEHRRVQSHLVFTQESNRMNIFLCSHSER